MQKEKEVFVVAQYLNAVTEKRKVIMDIFGDI